MTSTTVPTSDVPNLTALELDDIQHILLTRTPALTGEYVFVSFRDPISGRKWLNGLLDTVRSAADAQASLDSSRRWVTRLPTWTRPVAARSASCMSTRGAMPK